MFENAGGMGNDGKGMFNQKEAVGWIRKGDAGCVSRVWR